MKINKVKFQLMAKAFLVISVAAFFAACNKPLPDAVPIIYPDTNSSDQTIGDKISADTTYSIFLAAATRVGMINNLKDPGKVYTAFIPNNAAFRLSGIPANEVIGMLPITTVGAIVQYALIPGHQYTSADIPGTFPNIQLPTALTIGALPGTPLPLQMTIFPSKGANGFWVNNVPVVAPDMKFKNGVIHNVAFIVSPPAKVLKDAIYSDPNLQYFKAAIARADSGTTGLGSFDYLLGYPVTNMTVLVPNDDAFKQLIYGSIYSYLLPIYGDAIADAQAKAFSSTPAVFQDSTLFKVLTARKVRGILAYHFLATKVKKTIEGKEVEVWEPNIRAFSNNFETTPTFHNTLVNSADTLTFIHPGIIAQATFTGPFVSSLKFTGLGTFPPGGAPYSGAPAMTISKDNIAVNGVYYVIDKVLLPQ